MKFEVITDVETRLEILRDDALIRNANDRRQQVENVEYHYLSAQASLEVSDKTVLTDEAKTTLQDRMTAWDTEHVELVSDWKKAEAHAKEARERQNVRMGLNPDGTPNVPSDMPSNSDEAVNLPGVPGFVPANSVPTDATL